VPDLITAKNAQEYVTAYKQFIKNVKEDKGHVAIANQCVNGVEMFWKPNVKRGEIYQYLVDDDTVVGLSRIFVPENGDAKIQDVVAYPDGKGYGSVLITSAISMAKTANKKMIWLEAASEGVGAMYKNKFKFQFTASKATSGRMELALEE
jgi:hypothetical protein